MSLLKDLRCRITMETHCVLEAQTRSTGKDRQEIVREVLHAWAQKRLEEHKVLTKLLNGESRARESEGSQADTT